MWPQNKETPRPEPRSTSWTRFEVLENSFMWVFKPLEATARASAQISAIYRANPILPLRVYLSFLSSATAMREYEFMHPHHVLLRPLRGGGASWACTVARPGFVPVKSSRPGFRSSLCSKAPSAFKNCTSVSVYSTIRVLELLLQK